jgi:hypothetical protein
LRSVAYTNCDGNGNSGCKRNAYLDANTDADADSYSYSNIDTSNYSDANTYCEAHSHTKAAPDAAASAVEIFAGAKTSSD